MSELLDRLRRTLSERYAMERQVGQGTAAVVYLAHDRKHDRQVAVKLLLPDLTSSISRDRFLREIQIAAKLSHPRIVPLHDSGVVDGLLYYVMPYVEGESLRDRLSRDKRLPLQEALRITRDVAGALDYAHARDVVHRDIKPENILLQGGEAVVADFGIARAMTIAGTNTVTKTGMTVGTPAYMSPEQGAGSRKLDGRTDLYSLACVLYEVLAGHPPFVGATPQEILARHALDPVPRLVAARPDVPAGVEQAVMKGLAKKPGQRFATVTEFAEALSGDHVPARPAGPPGGLRRLWRALRETLRPEGDS
ncbi:MAG TPA: serine/threonine-protein kinase [Gemmatimonadales bacterium]